MTTDRKCLALVFSSIPILVGSDGPDGCGVRIDYKVLFRAPNNSFEAEPREPLARIEFRDEVVPLREHWSGLTPMIGSPLAVMHDLVWEMTIDEDEPRV